MVSMQVDTWGLNIALQRMIKALNLDIQQTTLHQSKLLCLDLAKAASPRPKGVKGLAASIPKIWANRIAGNIGSIVKGARALSLFHIARLNNASIFRNGFYPTKANPTRRVVGYYRLATGAVRERYAVSALYRINQASQKDPDMALKNLRQVLKAHLGGTVPKVYNNFMGRAVDDYYDATRKKARSRGAAVDRVYINTSDPKQERDQLLAQIIPSIGTVKAGWIQAGLSLPVKGGPRIPAWLTGKKTVGTGNSNAVSSVSTKSTVVGVSLTNYKGNAIGMNDRTNYVAKTLRYRKTKMITFMENALKAKARQWHNKKFNASPLALAPTKSDAGDEPPE